MSGDGLDPAQRSHLWRCSWMTPGDCGCRTTADGKRYYECRHSGCDRRAKACGGYCGPCFKRVGDESGLSTTVRLGRELVRASVHWFPEMHGRGEWDVIRHFALGIGGEAGEVLDVVKKADVCGGFADTCGKHPDGKHSLVKLTDEIGDLLAYVLELAATVGIDPEEAVRGCQAKCAERWGAVPPRQPAPANYKRATS